MHKRACSGFRPLGQKSSVTGSALVSCSHWQAIGNDWSTFSEPRTTDKPFVHPRERKYTDPMPIHSYLMLHFPGSSRYASCCAMMTHTQQEGQSGCRGPQ